ncbi:MAG: diaminopimelate epimerase [Bdellovibrionota bacterium]
MSAAHLSISKLVATGNDFIFIDARGPLEGAFARISRDELTKRLCDRHFGVGADGVVFVTQDAQGLAWDFFNNDGSHAEMCGNATRCMGRWAQDVLHVPSVEFKTAAGKVVATVEGENVVSKLDFVHPQLKWIYADNHRAALVNTGVPHVVVQDKIEDAKANWQAIKSWRFHPEAGIKGANVTFLEIEGPTKFKTVTFERGVEDFTLACGTGVLAAAAVGLVDQKSGFDAEVVAPGGKLRVHFNRDFNGAVLAGPARLVFKTVLGEEILR